MWKWFLLYWNKMHNIGASFIFLYSRPNVLVQFLQNSSSVCKQACKETYVFQVWWWITKTSVSGSGKGIDRDRGEPQGSRRNIRGRRDTLGWWRETPWHYDLSNNGFVNCFLVTSEVLSLIVDLMSKNKLINLKYSF